ncbi:hypothetical protein HF896_00200 (plasmid) [Alicycliphilus denitrificans]|uniref:Uncharacterized protein n=1 Tax=Alicycliphilus denitrificans TaxID=179636 RepID=A0A858ZMU2_9BURK|nr:hypothetical protein [Alicycliphilus denitrificans]QKD42082.1 hypothetical protein HF896_00045 [Alicycliphilus denitrificans]QKD42110.1 hypothetical protein HF896_00200 [Alicycliphilus denitrificans]
MKQRLLKTWATTAPIHIRQKVTSPVARIENSRFDAMCGADIDLARQDLLCGPTNSSHLPPHEGKQ